MVPPSYTPSGDPSLQTPAQRNKAKRATQLLLHNVPELRRIEGKLAEALKVSDGLSLTDLTAGQAADLLEFLNKSEVGLALVIPAAQRKLRDYLSILDPAEVAALTPQQDEPKPNQLSDEEVSRLLEGPAR